jgi:hypothetical protein
MDSSLSHSCSFEGQKRYLESPVVNLKGRKVSLASDSREASYQLLRISGLLLLCMRASDCADRITKG